MPFTKTPTVTVNLMNESEVAEFLGVSRSYLRQARMKDRVGPPFIRLGRNIRYSRAALEEWLASNTEESE